MVRRSGTNNEAPLDASQAQPMMPPDGAAVDVETKLRYRMEGSAGAELFGRREAGITDEDIEALAGEDLQLDPLSHFCAEWANFIGYSLVIVRLPDPAARRMPGNQFRNPCFEVENLGEIPFDPNSLVATLQMVNGNSGGAFRLFLRDHNGQLIPNARLDRVVISDPARGYSVNPANNPPGAPVYSAPQAPKAPEKSAFEQRIETMQAQLFETAINRALNPPVPPPGSTLSDEDRLAVLLLSKGDLLGNVINKITAIAQAPDAAAATPSWKDRIIDAGIDIASKNPVLIDRVSQTIERIVQTILPPRVGVPITEPVSYAPAAEPGNPQYNPQQPALQPQQPPVNPNSQATAAAQFETLNVEESDPTEDDDMAEIVERIITRLGETTPLSMGDPLFAELAKEYPLKFRFICGLIVSQDVDDIIAFIADKSELYEMLLSSPASGPHYRARLIELQQLLKQAKQSAEEKIAQQNAQQTAAPPPGETDTDPAKS